MIEKYNRVNNAPTYKVTRVNQRTAVYDKELLLKHIGVYNSEKYGVTAYFDYQLEPNGEIFRCSFPSYMLRQIDEMSHDDETMEEIHDGGALIKLSHYTTKSGNDTMEVKFIDRKHNN